MKIYVAADHNGFDYKSRILEQLKHFGYEAVDAGDTKINPDDDFPQFAARAVRQLLADKDDSSRAVLICGSGQGMAIAANRFKGIRASLCWNLAEARAARNDDDSNVLCLSVQNTSLKEAESILQTWLQTPFAGASRFVRRIKELDRLP